MEAEDLEFTHETEVSESPKPGDADWQEYVMSKFNKNELFNGHPKVAGLRRVAELTLGPITGGRTTVFQSPNPSNQFTAVVGYEVEISCFNEYVRTFSSCADSSRENTDPTYRLYPTAIAETRAEARALRKALQIDIASADELSEVAKLDSIEASMAQMKAIDSLIKRKKIDKQEFAKENKLVFENGDLVLTYEEARSILGKLNSKGVK